MAYHDEYDPRLRASRRANSFTTQSREDSHYVEPASPSHRRGGQWDDRYDGGRASKRSSAYPPAPPPDNGRPGPPRARPQRAAPPPSRRRHSYPPVAIVEDETVSLAKEAGTSKLLQEIAAVKDEARSRGTVDQEPIVQDATEHVNQDEGRPVVVSDSEKEAKSIGIPTPPTSEDERARKLRRRPSRLNTDLGNGVPEMSRRTASPYAMSRPTKLQQEASSTDKYLSPTTLTPPPTESRRRSDKFSTSSKPSSPRRDSARLSPRGQRKGNDYFEGNYSSSDNAVLDDAYDTSDHASYNRRRQPQRPPPSKVDERPKTSPQTSVVDFASIPTGNTPIRRLNLDARRNTDTANTLPTLPSLRVDRARHPSPLMAASAFALSDLADSAVHSQPGTPMGADTTSARSRESSYVHSRAVSPAAAVSQREQTPPRSPRHSAECPAGCAGNGGSSGGSGPTSATSSRPQSPSPRTPGVDSPRLPKTDLDWSTLLAANAMRTRTKPPSRLATSTRTESLPDVPQVPYSAGPYPGPASRPGASLPYPEEYGPGTPTMYMPSERDHQYFPTPPKSALGVPLPSDPKTLSRDASPAPSNASYTSTGSRPARPPLTSRHSVANDSPADERPRLNETRKVSFTSSSQTKKELAALLKKGLPDCRRADPVAGKDDWYTVIGSPALTFCEDCVDHVFERTLYRPSIRRLPQLNFSEKVKCSLGSSAWMRLAWLLTLQRNMVDMTLLTDLAKIEEESEPCPGSQDAVRSWYGLRDDEGYFVRDFHVCFADVRKIELLLPTLSGFLVRMPGRASYGSYKCAMRAEGNRFSTYLDALITTEERAKASRRGADTMPFIDLVERKSRIPDCSRDNMLMNALWHFIPNTSLTVCADCYDAIVEPEVRKGSDVAMRFNRTVQPVYGEGMGSSCQLYSNRMRKIFRRAVEDNDLKYLARKSKERREAELRLQERYREIQRRANRMSREGNGSEEDEWRLNREVEKISTEWKEKYE